MTKRRAGRLPGSSSSPGEPGTTASGTGGAERGPATRRPRGRSRGGARQWLLLVAIGVLAAVLVRGFVVQTFYVPSASMENTLLENDRIVALRLGYGPGAMRRGDVIVFDGRGSFDPDDTPTSPLPRAVDAVRSWVGIGGSAIYVKRVIGLPGDHVRCCDARGRITVNGTPLTEPYLYPGNNPSDQAFDITVPAGRLWVMGDHRADSADSRAHLGDAGGGTVPQSRVVGRVLGIWWPVDRWTGIGRQHYAGLGQ